MDSEVFVGGYDFNKATEFPKEFKNRKKSLDDTDGQTKAYPETLSRSVKTFKNIDTADTIRRYYKNDETTTLPKGFSYTNIKTLPQTTIV